VDSVHGRRFTRTLWRRLGRRILIPLGFGLGGLGVVGLSAIGISAAVVSNNLALQPGDSANVTCTTTLSGSIGATTANLLCAALPTATATKTAVPVSTPTRTSVPTATATPTMVMPMPTMTPVPGAADGATGNSAAFGIWVPTARDTCTAAEHDAFYVVGPDGLRYPTWHPPVFTRANGSTCTFGHEHGQNPRLANDWLITQRHYAHQLPDGSLDLAHAGIPFAYANQQMDAWIAATGNTAMAMRHEDHVGHKVAIANNFQIGLDSGNGTGQFFYPGVTCNYIVSYHQGTHSKDAFENNLHQILYNSDCSDGHGLHIDQMGQFGKVGEFTRFCDQNGVRSTAIVTTGTDFASPSFPGSTNNGGARTILDRACVEAVLLVPVGQWSGNPYEAWPVNFGITRANGTAVVDGLNLLFDTEDSIRYYWPGHASVAGGAVDNLGHFQDLCTENFNGRTFRGGVCDAGLRTATWDDPRSAFRDLNRGVYFKPGVTHNAGGSTVWYTDPFGRNAQTTPFPGSLKQLVSSDSVSYAAKAGTGVFETANVINMFHNDGGHTVHAPN
jgi:hypothetical protein